MKKYSIQFKPYDKYLNASSKPMFDVIKICQREGYKPLFVAKHHDSRPGKIRTLNSALECLYIRTKLKKDDIILMQWPFTSCKMFILFWAVRKCKNIQILVHDIGGMRFGKEENPWMPMFFIIAKSIIVHTPSMKQYLVANGVKENKIVVLGAFDYLTDDKSPDNREKTKDVVFAGNLAKSEFLEKIPSSCMGLTINCYGKKIDNLADGLTYKGAFTPDNVSVLEGSWGLVWDGDSTDTCSGVLGEYLRYNSPHKISLYIVAHLPVIVWERSALADYVKEKGLGICVSSLNEISGRIDAMSDKEYSTIIENVKKEAINLKAGNHLRHCLLTAE